MEVLCEEVFARVPPFRPEPAIEQVRAALAHLEAAERPVLVAGGGVRAWAPRQGPGPRQSNVKLWSRRRAGECRSGWGAGQ